MIGCYQDSGVSSLRDLDGPSLWSGNMTLQRCVNFCVAEVSEAECCEAPVASTAVKTALGTTVDPTGGGGGGK